MPASLDHVAIAVEDLDAAIAFYRDVLGLSLQHVEQVAEQNVRAALFGSGRGRIELISPSSPESSVRAHLDKRGEGLHHICLEVDDIVAALAEAKARGAKLIDETPRVGAEGARIAFIHPKGAHGVLTELRQSKK